MSKQKLNSTLNKDLFDEIKFIESMIRPMKL